MKTYAVSPGSRYPFGATLNAGGVNFSIFSRNASAADLLLFADGDSREPFQVISLDPELNRTFYSWHVHVEGLPAGTHYNWRIDGPDDTAAFGFRFDPEKALLDPWARAVSDRLWQRDRARGPGSNMGSAIRGVVVQDDYDWEGDTPLRLPAERAIIYELHPAGFTRDPSSQVSHPGTFAGLMEKVPYLQQLGITHVELMPIMAFDEQDVPPGVAERGLKNFWGYSPYSYYALHPGYCLAQDPNGQLREFRDLVKALHRAGIGVILDVVFNHTAEGGADGPTIHFKGFGNEIFYHLDPEDRRLYRDYTGCGNTVNANHPLLVMYITECLEYWVREMHVDGFRFDLASALARGEDGKPQYHAPVLWSIELSDTLAATRLVAEAWDAGGLYQVGGFPGFRWQEWNGRYRDLVRQFVRGDPALVGELATRLAGSSDLYQGAGRLPSNSINFVTSHDGFTLYDLVSYHRKYNRGNGEENRDGSDHNLSWNCGVEGPTADPEVLDLRRRQAKNFFAVLLLSQGVPMLLAGDELLRSQQGNNNAWCQDNEIGWIDWRLAETNADMLHFVRELIALRRRHPCLMRRHFLGGRNRDAGRLPEVSWHGTRPGEPDWDDPQARYLAFTLAAVDPKEEDLHVVLNMSESSHRLALPELPDRVWYRAMDTAEPSPRDVLPKFRQQPLGVGHHLARPRSVLVFESRSPGWRHSSP